MCSRVRQGRVRATDRPTIDGPGFSYLPYPGPCISATGALPSTAPRWRSVGFLAALLQPLYALLNLVHTIVEVVQAVIHILPKLLALLPAQLPALLPTVRTVLATPTAASTAASPAAATSATSFAFASGSLEVTPPTRSASPAHAVVLL